MNRPDKPGELSIDEILASIRQKTSEEPDASRPALASAPEAPPPVGPSQAAPPEMPPSLQDRLNGTFKKGSFVDTSGAEGANGAKRPLPFDQDLADILDEPDTAGVASATPKPEMRVSPEVGAAAAKPHAAATHAPAEPAPVAAATSASPPSSPSPTSDPVPSAPLAAPPAFGRAFADSAAAPRPQAFGFPPLTKREGFYPAERPEPVLPPVRSDDLVKSTPPSSPRAGDAASPGPSLSSGAGARLDRASTSEPATRFPDFGSVVPSDVAGRSQPTPESAFGAPPRAASGAVPPGGPHGGMNGLSLRPPQLDGPGLAPPAPSVVPNPTLPEPATASVSPKPDAAPIATPPMARAPTAAPAPTPAGQTAAPGAAETVDTAAAATALGALAQGLAASTAKSDAADVGTPPPQERAAAPGASPQATAPIAPAPVSPALAPAPVAGQPASDLGAAPGRTLEDVVADMLRPMLQKWVAENMPRIMEKALRSEMQRTLGAGGGTKPPGS